MRLACGFLAALLAILASVAEGQVERGSNWGSSSRNAVNSPATGGNSFNQPPATRLPATSGNLGGANSSGYRPGSVSNSNPGRRSTPLTLGSGSSSPANGGLGNNAIINNTIRNNTIRNNTIRNNTIRNNTIRNNTTGSNAYGNSEYGNSNAGNRPPGRGAASNSLPQRLVPSRQATFSIPFQVPTRGPNTVVELHVSADRGQNWHIYSRQRPEVGRFQFTSRRDGEYWFASRTIDRSQPAPQQPIQPQLRMLIDTTRPQLKIDAVAGTTGQVTVNWTAFDKNLEASTLKLEYQSAPNAPWQPIRQSPQNRVGTSRLDGNVNWSPQPDLSSILVRVEIRDIAGNIAAATHRLIMPRKAQESGRSTLNQRSSPGAIEWGPNGSKVEPNRRSGDPGISNSQDSNAGRSNSAGSNRGATTNNESSALELKKPYQPVTGEANPPVRDQFRPQTGRVQANLPAGQTAQWTTSGKFNLDYNVDVAGSKGVSAVELWGTRDGGRNWQRWGNDDDLKSPMPVQVDRVGVYGYRIVVVGKNGVASDAPKAGDMADIWIGIDRTKPVVRLDAVGPGTGPNAGSVIFDWQASDNQMHSAPITIQYRGQGATAWTDVVRGQLNTGRYVWQPTLPLPRQISVRIVAKDQAGNIADDTKHDVRLQQTPSGRINHFSPARN